MQDDDQVLALDMCGQSNKIARMVGEDAGVQPLWVAKGRISDHDIAESGAVYRGATVSFGELRASASGGTYRVCGCAGRFHCQLAVDFAGLTPGNLRWSALL